MSASTHYAFRVDRKHIKCNHQKKLWRCVNLIELKVPPYFLTCIFLRCIDENCPARLQGSRYPLHQFVYVTELHLEYSCGVLQHTRKISASRIRFLVIQEAVPGGNFEETIDASPSNIREALKTHLNSNVSC